MFVENTENKQKRGRGWPFKKLQLCCGVELSTQFNHRGFKSHPCCNQCDHKKCQMSIKVA